MQNNRKIIAIFGAGGFIGKHLMRQLTNLDYRIKVATRNPYIKGYLKPLGSPGQIELFKTNIFDQKNVEQVAEITQRLEEAEVAVLTSYEGLTVAQMGQLRDVLREASVQYKVYKNRLIQVSANNLDIEGLEAYLHGTTAVATSDDPASLTKALIEFSEDNEDLKIKGGILGGQVIDQAATAKLVDMPSKDQLRGQVAASLKAPINAIAQVLAAPMRDLAGVVNSLNDQPRKLASLLQAVADQKSET